MAVMEIKIIIKRFDQFFHSAEIMNRSANQKEKFGKLNKIPLKKPGFGIIIVYGYFSRMPIIDSIKVLL